MIPHSTWSSREVTPAAAIRRIAAGARIFIGSGAAQPTSLVGALVEHGDHLASNEVVHMLTLGPASYCDAAYQTRFRHRAFFIGENVREAVHAGRADFVPIFLSEIPALLRERVRVDVALIQVGLPDAHGMVSLGVSVDIVRAAIDSARLVIAEINPRMPRTHGDSFLSVDRIDLWTSVDRPIISPEQVEPGPVERAIAQHVARLVPNGATVQTGIGRIPDAVLAALENHADLGIHTEMFSDGVMTLCERGVINGSRKTLLPGKMVTSFIIGSQRLYEWANDHPNIEMRPSDFTNDPFIIAQNERMVAINSALAIDLTGQVAADTLAGRHYSGIGGQVDFVRGAARSVGGTSIIALPSMAKHGISRICSSLEAGTGVTTSRGDVRYVVTEYGAADLWGRSVRERAGALIEIAHPDVRAQLRAQVEQLRML
ncbi:MAG: acetyl-CoA hydrolase/transferase family protein [Myxococcaceae bacterium]|nr:acetyl-CoA hydrolase/transferase family protein [Myxococcaceae bacterium]